VVNAGSIQKRPAFRLVKAETGFIARQTSGSPSGILAGVIAAATA
jgi:hypothetical protein